MAALNALVINWSFFFMVWWVDLEMKLFRIFIVSFSSILLSQNLVFFNDEESIIFTENELITINGKEYRYEKALENRTQIRLLKSGLLRKENIVFDTNKIETFRTHKVRYSTRNAFKKAFKGFKVGFAGCGVFAFGLGYDGSMGISSKIEKIGAGIFVGSVFGTLFGTIIGAPVGFVYGFESLGESKLYNSNDYKIKFDDNIKSNIINQE